MDNRAASVALLLLRKEFFVWLISVFQMAI
nr:MAG TPA: hypothetical protein [Caudoviricetes sp.]